MIKRIEIEMPAGTYIIGDPGYFLGHRWDTVGIFRGPAPGNCLIHMGKTADDFDFTQRPLPSLEEMHKQYPVVLLPTSYGDGGYADNDGHTYSVDSGSLGMVPVELAQPGSEVAGRVVEFECAFDVVADYKDDIIRFGNIVVDLVGG